jgi:outer membrane biosynthesis protein TonB
MRHALSLAAATLVLAACASGGATPENIESEAPTASAAVAPSDGCPSIVAQFLAKPDSTPVTKVPAPLEMKPRPFRPPYPQDLLKKGKAEIKLTVMVDTLGKPNISTFKVVKSTHPWLTNQAINAIAKWTFTPAEVNGCKVPRNYLFSATMGG